MIIDRKHLYRCLLFLFVILFFEWNTNAQESHSLPADTTFTVKDTVIPVRKNFGYYFKPFKFKHEPHKARFQLQLDLRNSFVRDYPIDVYGLNAGVKFRNRIRVGAGFYFALNNFNSHPLPIDLKTGRVLIDRKGNTMPTNDPQGKAVQQLTLFYGTVNFTYTFYNSRAFELSIPLEIGYGHFKEQLVLQSNDQSIGLSRTPAPSSGVFVPVLAGVGTLIKVHKWVYLQASVGYRKSLAENYFNKRTATSVYSQLDGFYWHVGAQLNLNNIVRDFKSWKTDHRNDLKTR